MAMDYLMKGKNDTKRFVEETPKRRKMEVVVENPATLSGTVLKETTEYEVIKDRIEKAARQAIQNKARQRRKKKD